MPGSFWIAAKLLWQQILQPAAIVGFMLLLGYGEAGRYTFCEQCGLRRSEESKKMFGLPVRTHVKDRKTEFHQLYIKYVSPTCQHRWRQTSRYWMQSYGLLGGGVSCGSWPPILFQKNDSKLLLLKRLHDPTRIAAILKFLSHDSGASEQQHANMMLAIEELEEVKTRTEADTWWQHYRTLLKIK